MSEHQSSPSPGRNIFSNGYDGLFFFLPPLLLLPLPWLQQFLFPPKMALWVMIIAFMHEGFLWGLYLDSGRNRVHRARWVPFFLIPVLLFLTFLTVRTLDDSRLITAAGVLFIAWN